MQPKNINRADDDESENSFKQTVIATTEKKKSKYPTKCTQGNDMTMIICVADTKFQSDIPLVSVKQMNWHKMQNMK